MSESTSTARAGALAKLAEEAARFSAAPSDEPTRPRRVRTPAAPSPTHAPSPVVEASPLAPVSALTVAEPAGPATREAYVPVAVAPERGNTRPVVPVDGRLHMRVAQPTLDAIDGVLRDWKTDRPELRDLERATLVRVGLALVLADIRAHGRDGAVGEAIDAALDPRVRHTDTPMPDLGRWLSRPTR